MSKRATILVVDDDPVVSSALLSGLSRRGYEVTTARDGREAAEALQQAPDLLLLDRGLPDLDGIELLALASRLDRPPKVVMMTGRGDTDSIVAAMRAGAWDYVVKPAPIESIAAVVERSLEADELEDPSSSHAALDALVGRAPTLRQVKSLLHRIAQTPSSTVLVTGESGTGKDLAARAIHRSSARRDGPFVNVTCSALPHNLLESELFGHERGAFTDAKARRVGLVEQASGGTLFLDEMGDLDANLQAKLLRFLEDKHFRRVGGTSDLHADVRVIAATNIDLAAAVAAGRFREDLYYRLAVLTVELPPLRERPGDIPRLTTHFVGTFARQFDSRPLVVTPAALERLEAHPWPGNVRELKNTIERAVLLAPGPWLVPRDLQITPSARDASVAATHPEPMGLPASGLDLKELERNLVRQALLRCRGNVTRAARLLGLNRDQVRYRVSKFHLEDDLAAQRSAS